MRAKFATGLERRVHRHLGLLELRHPLADLRRPEAADPFLARFQHEVGRGLGALEHGVGDLDLVQVLARLGVVVLVPKEKEKEKKKKKRKRTNASGSERPMGGVRHRRVIEHRSIEHCLCSNTG